MDPVGFLNVDLDLEADEDLSEVLRAMTPAAFTLHAECSRDGSVAHLELERDVPDADSAVVTFVGLIDGLPPEGRVVWERIRVRDFNVGIQAPVEYGPVELALQAETLAAVARLGARVVVTVYGGTEAPTHVR